MSIELDIKTKPKVKIPEYLPTPLIAKRKVDLGRVDVNDPQSQVIRRVLDSLSTRVTDIPTLTSTVFPEAYYVELLDVYFDSYGNRDWLQLPDKRLEFVMVSNNNYKGTPEGQTISGLEVSGNGNKDNFTNALVHPANTSQDNQKVYNGIFSGGQGGDPNEAQTGNPIGVYVNPTEWKIDETQNSFGDNVFNHGKNKLNNPNITIALDVRKFFRKSGRVPVEYPLSLSQESICVKNIGKITLNGITQKVYRRNAVLFLRLSAGVPDSKVLGKMALYKITTIGSINDGDVFSYDLGNGNTGSFTYNSTIEPNFLTTLKLQIQNDYPNKFTIYIKNGDLYIREKVYTGVDFVPIINNITQNSNVCDITVIKPSNSNVTYNSRIYSDLSLPIYIKPKIGKFLNVLGDINLGSDWFCFGHQLVIGSK